MRIASLLPSATEIVDALGLADQLVGLSADSDWPGELVRRLPVLNTVAIDPTRMTSAEIDAAASSGHRGASLYHIDPDLLRSVRPDVILTQETCEVCAVSRRDVELATRTLGYTPQVLSLSPVTLEQMLEDIERVAQLTGAIQRGGDLVRSLRDRLDAVKGRTAGLPRPSVFCMEWLDPPYSAGHWMPEMVELAGGCDGLGTPAGPSRRIAWDDVVAYAPEVVVLIPCSLDLERIASEFGLLKRLPDWQRLPAVKASRVYAGDTALFSRSGPRLVDGVETLARILHPEVCRDPIPPNQALRISADGQRLEPYR